MNVSYFQHQEKITKWKYIRTYLQHRVTDRQNKLIVLKGEGREEQIGRLGLT